MIDEALKQWATPTQAKYIDAVNAHGGFRPAARALGVQDSSVRDAVRACKVVAAAKGYSPEHAFTHPVPDPHVARGVSTLYDEDGQVKLQWVKSRLDDEKLEQARKIAWKAMAEDLPRVVATPSPRHAQDDLCNVYTLTDCHVGMRAWHKEGGADWDLAIAEETLVKAFVHMVRSSPKAKACVVANLGDFVHYDSLVPETPASKHVLDADSRFSKMIRAAVRILRALIAEALKHHEVVIVLLGEGNHDPASAAWLRVAFEAIYENEPRVKIIDSEVPFYCYQHGKTMLAWHHGHTKKLPSLPLLFAAEYPRVWGETKYRYCHTGHYHHIVEREDAGMQVRQHPTLAARDAYAARHGYHALRAATSITYSKRFGEVGRVTVNPEMLEEA